MRGRANEHTFQTEDPKSPEPLAGRRQAGTPPVSVNKPLNPAFRRQENGAVLLCGFKNLSISGKSDRRRPTTRKVG